jgi:hypothetical protein
MAAASLRYYHRKAERNRQAGLNTRGGVRKVKLWSELGGLRGDERVRARVARQRQANLAAGLRHDGKPRRHRRYPELDRFYGRARRNAYLRNRYAERQRQKKMSALEQAYCQLRQEFGEVTLPEISTASVWRNDNS